MTRLALLGNRMSYLRRRALTGVVVLTAGFLACRENPADVAPTGELAIGLAVAEGVSLAQVDQVRVRLRSAGAADINFTLSGTANRFEGTRQNLAPGTYTVTIRGITGGEVEFFGETTANVQIGVDANVNITLTSFLPAIDPILNTTSVNFTATWPAVTGAEGYEVYASSDPTFQTSFAPDLLTDLGGTFSADFTAPGIGEYYVHVRTERAGIEPGLLAEQTAHVVDAVLPTATLVSSTIAAASDVKLFGVSAAGGEGMLVLAFQTGVSAIDLDVSIGPVDGVRVGGDHNMGAIDDNGIEWLLAYEYPTGPTPSRTSTTSQPANIVALEPSSNKPATKTTPEAVVARLRSLTAAAPAAPSASADAQTFTSERGIQVSGANGTTGDFDLFFDTCVATEVGLDPTPTGGGTLADTDCFTFNPVSGDLTRGHFWVFNAIGGEMVDIQLTSAAFDPVLFLFGPDGNLVWYNDDFNGLDSRLITTLPSDGMHIAFVASFDSLAIGAYGLTLDLFAGTNADGATSTISATPGLITADGGSTSTVTVQLNDASGATITTGGDAVSLETDLGSLSGLTDNANGSYTATLTAGTTGGIATVTGYVNGMWINSSATVALANPSSTADPTNSTVAASPSSIPADGVSWAGVRVQLKDAFGTNLTVGGDAVLLTTDAGTLGTITDNGDGSYNAMLTASNAVETALVSGTLNGVAMTSNSTVQFITPTSACSTIPTGIGANVGGSLDSGDCDAPHRPGSFAELWRFDGAAGQVININLGDSTGTFDTYLFLLGTDGTTILAENDDCGADLDSCLLAQTLATTGTYTIEATTFDFDDTGDYTLTIRERAQPTTSTITAFPTSIPADGFTTATITVQGKGLGGGNVAAGGDGVTLITSLGTMSAVTDNGDGSYTATLTSPTSGTATITGTIRGIAITDTAIVTLTP